MLMRWHHHLLAALGICGINVAQDVSAADVENYVSRCLTTQANVDPSRHFAGRSGPYRVSGAFLAEALTAEPQGPGIAIANLSVSGSIDCYGQRIVAVAEFRDCKFENTFSFNAAALPKGIAFHRCKFDQLSLRAATVSGSILFDRCEFAGTLSLDELMAERQVTLSACQLLQAERSLTATLAFFGGSCAFSQCTLVGTMRMVGATTNRDLIVDGCTCDTGELDLERVDVRGAMVINGGRFANVTMARGTVRALRVKDATIGYLYLDLLAVADELAINDAKLLKLVASSARVAGRTMINRVRVADMLHFEYATLGVVGLRQLELPSDPQSVHLRGATYSAITALGDDDMGEIVSLPSRCAYSPTVYRQLYETLCRDGLTDVAADVAISQKRRERDEAHFALYIWSLFLDGVVGYGFRKERALLLCALVIGLGVIVFRHNRMFPRGAPERTQTYRPYWYSFDLFMPVINLGMESEWRPANQYPWTQRYMYFHQILGWLLVPVVIAAWSGAFAPS